MTTYRGPCQRHCASLTAPEELVWLQTGEAWNRCVRPKAIGSWNLDAASRGLRHLEHFVFFSSIVATQGNAGEQPGRQPFLCKPCLACFCLQHAFTMGRESVAALRLPWWLLQARPAMGSPTCTAASCAGRAGQPGCPACPSGGALSATLASWLRLTRHALAHLTSWNTCHCPCQYNPTYHCPCQYNSQPWENTAAISLFSPAEQHTVCLPHALSQDRSTAAAQGKVSRLSSIPCRPLACESSS